jgi:hypothetical protein
MVDADWIYAKNFQNDTGLKQLQPLPLHTKYFPVISTFDAKTY